jgi:hypothetical protein
MSNLHRAFDDAKSAGALVERVPAKRRRGHRKTVDQDFFKSKPKIVEKPPFWDSMTTKDKVNWVKVNGPTSELPVSVEVAKLINEGNVKTFKKQLLRSELIRRGGVVRVLISPGEFVLFQQRVIHAGLKHAENTLAREYVRLDEIGEPVDDPDSGDKSKYDPNSSMNRRIYGGLRKIRASQLDRLNCKVQIIMSADKVKDSFHFSGVLTYECLLMVLSEIEISDADIQRLRERVVEKHLEVVSFSKPLKAGRLVHDIDVPCDPCFHRG